MADKPILGRTLRTVSWTIATILGLLMAYLTAYRTGFDTDYNEVDGGQRLRTFQAEWTVRLFVPAVWVEAKLTRMTVSICTAEGDHGYCYTAYPSSSPRF